MAYRKLIAGHYEYVPLDGDSAVFVHRFVPESMPVRVSSSGKDLAAIKARLAAGDIDDSLNSIRTPPKIVSDMIKAQNQRATGNMAQGTNKKELPEGIRELYESGLQGLEDDEGVVQRSGKEDLPAGVWEAYEQGLQDDQERVIKEFDALLRELQMTGSNEQKQQVRAEIAKATKKNEIDLALVLTEKYLTYLYGRGLELYQGEAVIDNAKALINALSRQGAEAFANELYEEVSQYAVLLTMARRIEEAYHIANGISSMRPDDLKNGLHILDLFCQKNDPAALERQAVHIIRMAREQDNTEIRTLTKELLCQHFYVTGAPDKAREFEEYTEQVNDVPALFRMYMVPVDVHPSMRDLRIEDFYTKNRALVIDSVFHQIDNGFIPRTHFDKISRVDIFDKDVSAPDGREAQIYFDDAHPGKMIMELYSKGSDNHIYHAACHELGHVAFLLLSPEQRLRWSELCTTYDLTAPYIGNPNCDPVEEAFADAYAAFAMLREYWKIMVDAAARDKKQLGPDKNTVLYEFFERVFADHFGRDIALPVPDFIPQDRTDRFMQQDMLFQGEL